MYNKSISNLTIRLNQNTTLVQKYGKFTIHPHKKLKHVYVLNTPPKSNRSCYDQPFVPLGTLIIDTQNHKYDHANNVKPPIDLMLFIDHVLYNK